MITGMVKSYLGKLELTLELKNQLELAQFAAIPANELQSMLRRLRRLQDRLEEEALQIPEDVWETEIEPIINL